MTLGKRGTNQLCIEFVSSVASAATSSDSLREAFLAATQSVKLTDGFLTAAIVRVLYTLEGVPFCKAFLSRHVHLRHHGSVAKEVLSLPLDATRPQELPFEPVAEALETSTSPGNGSSQELFRARRMVRNAKNEINVWAEDNEFGADLVAFRKRLPLVASPRWAVCFFGQVRDLSAYSVLRDQVEDMGNADMFMATWNTGGTRQIEPHGSLVFVRELIPAELRSWFESKSFRDFTDLQARLPDLYDLVTKEYAEPIDEVTIRGASRSVVGLNLDSPADFRERMAVPLGEEFEKRPLHVQNQIRMWYLINRVLTLRQLREEQDEMFYERVILIRSDLRFNTGSFERLFSLVESLEEGEVASDFDAMAWVVGGIGDRFFAGRSKDMDALMMPWRHLANCFAKGMTSGPMFLSDLSPHRIARDLLFASDLVYRPVARDVVDFAISRESSYLGTRIRDIAFADQQRK